eukprot:m.424634 g.424634  ORF g.424634 m.424634 type:complete len:190 (-) comp16856_c0_seq73:1461-2030(-)
MSSSLLCDARMPEMRSRPHSPGCSNLLGSAHLRACWEGLTLLFPSLTMRSFRECLSAIHCRRCQHNLRVAAHGYPSTSTYGQCTANSAQPSVPNHQTLTHHHQLLYYTLGHDEAVTLKSRNDSHLDGSTSIATTIDSIEKFNCLEVSEYVLILDEFNSLIEYIFMVDKCLGNKRLAVLSTSLDSRFRMP